MMNLPCNRSFAWLATGVVALLTACDSSSSPGDGGDKPGTGGTTQTGGSSGSGGNPGTGGSVASGGSPGTGGSMGSGGSLGTGGKVGSGGSPGTGGVASDGGLGVSCSNDGGLGLPAAGRQCAQDSDCTIATAARCCGADLALGEAKAQASIYASCLALPAGACQGLGCAKFLGYTTDTGRTTPVGNSSSQPIDFVSVSCLNQLCTTDVVDTGDGGRDAALVVDADAAAVDGGTEHTDVGKAIDACSNSIDAAPFIAKARNASCSSIKNSLVILDCSMVLWQVRGNCSDASYSYTLFGTTVDDVLCSYSDSIAGPRYVSNSAICATLFPPNSAGDFNLNGHTVTAIPF